MYTLNENQRKALDKFIKSIPSSTAKGKYESWNERVLSQNERLTTNDMEDFVSYSHSLDAELQQFPQEFAYKVKNSLEFNKEIPAAEVDKEEVKAEAKRNMELTAQVVEEVPEKVVTKEIPKVVVDKKVIVPAVVTKKK